MRTFNKAAAEVFAAVDGVHACTDITGFGLIGHATEMATASQVTLALQAADVPAFEGALDLVGKNRSGGLLSNQEYFESGVESRLVPVERLELMYDPQTSGGLLAAVAESESNKALQALATAGVAAWIVGSVQEQGATALVIR